MEEIRDRLICRACLRIVENKTQCFGYVEDANGNLKDMIMCCVPEMDIYVSSNPIMCLPCIQLLVTVYNFKTRCLNTETVIRSYIQRNNLTEYNQVNLNCIVQELIRLNNYFSDSQHSDKQTIESDPPKLNGITHNNTMKLIESPECCDSEFPCEIDRKNQVATENSFDLLRESSGETREALQHERELFKDTKQLSAMVNEAGSDQDDEESHRHDLSEAKTINIDSEAVRKKKRVRFEDNSKENFEKEPSKENRPRLIIKICKNKITIPPPKNERSSEKESQKIDAEPTERVEMPQLDANQHLYQCPNCTFVTTHAESILVHRQACGAESNKKCPHCPHVTNRQYALNKHINTMHTKSVWYTCDFCAYRSTDSSCLRRHKRNVHPDRLGNELTCRLCNYRCSTEYHLKKHMMKHDRSAALQCQFCSYSTRDRSNFRKHVFIHSPKPRHCEFCEYKCVSPYQMKLHLKKMHHGVGLEDVDCKSEVSISEVVQDISAAIKEAKGYLGHQAE